MNSIQLELPFLPEEEWKDIPGYENVYRVSSAGRVMRFAGGTGAIAGKILAQPTAQGYAAVCLTMNGKQKGHRVHKLVMLAFEGKCPDGMEINHINGIRDDNRLSNLEYCTRQENIDHARNILNHHNKGERHGFARLTESQVREIRKLRVEDGISLKDLSHRFGVSDVHIHNIATGKKWRHLI